jgi:uncharacterized protein (TIGR03067 family)
MTRLFLASIAVLSALAVVPGAGEAQKGALPKSNQVYVKIILPIDPATRGKDQPVVESWIAEQLKKRGQAKFTAATAWVPLDVKGDERTRVWDATLDGKGWGCPVAGQITKRADGRINILLNGWGPGGDEVTVSLTDETGSRAIAAVEELKDDSGMPYVAVLIGPPRENRAAATGDKKSDEEKLQGDWTMVSKDVQLTGGRICRFAGDKFEIIKSDGQVESKGTFKLDAKKMPKEIDLVVDKGERKITVLGIYELDGDKLKMSGNKGDGARPTAFDGTIQGISVFERKKKDKK